MRELQVVGALVEASIADVARKHGLSHAALNALAVIEGNGAPIATGEVSQHMHVTTGTTTSLLDTLERKGLVRRIPDPQDRRRVLVDVTADAQAILDRLLPEVQQLASATMGSLGDRANAELLRTLERVRAAFEATPEVLPPIRRRRPRHLDRTPD